MVSETLGRRVAAQDAERFVGRKAELELLERLLVEDPAANLVFIHGDAGIGKSTLLREFARRAERSGYRSRWIEGRELPPGPDAIEDALAGVREESRPLLVFDSYERIAALGGYLRRAVLPSLPADALVAIACRRPPEAGWLEEGWERVTTVLRLGPLPREEALRIVSREGVVGAEADRLLRWAGGSPLALTLGAQTRGAGELGGDEGDLVELLTTRIMDEDWGGTHRPTLWTAAIARSVTPRLLGDVLGDGDAEIEYEWLAGRTFTEPLSGGITVHELLRGVLRAQMRRLDPARERALRRSICDHLYARAREGETLLAIDLASLCRNEAIRWGFSWDAGARLRLDDVRRGDLEALEAGFTALGRRPGDAIRMFITDAPEHVAIVRDERERLCGYTIALTPETAPAFCARDPFLGPRLEHARGQVDPGSVVIWRDMVDLTGDPASGVLATLGMAGALRAAHGNPRHGYLPINPAIPEASEFSAALGAVRAPELDYPRGPLTIECHVLDYGEGGLLRAQRDLVYKELGLPAPPEERSAPDLLGAVRNCLRHLDEPQELAGSPLARGETMRERSSYVRALLEEAAENAFSPSPRDQLTRQALVRAYIDPAPSHELAADELSLSRSAYFRRLKQATERVASYVAAVVEGK